MKNQPFIVRALQIAALLTAIFGLLAMISSYFSDHKWTIIGAIYFGSSIGAALLFWIGAAIIDLLWRIAYPAEAKQWDLERQWPTEHSANPQRPTANHRASINHLSAEDIERRRRVAENLRKLS